MRIGYAGVSEMETREKRGVDFAGCTEGIDTMTAQGRLTVHIFGAWQSLSGTWPTIAR
jgi:DNA invertase Pin-like site-specific DNA recombinase